MKRTLQIPENIVTRFVEAARETIGKNLLGVYLHGSAAMGCFNPKSSDLDLLVGVKEVLDDSTKLHFMDRVVALHEEFVRETGSSHAGIEMSVVLQKACKPFVLNVCRFTAFQHDDAADRTVSVMEIVIQHAVRLIFFLPSSKEGTGIEQTQKHFFHGIVCDWRDQPPAFSKYPVVDFGNQIFSGEQFSVKGFPEVFRIAGVDAVLFVITDHDGRGGGELVISAQILPDIILQQIKRTVKIKAVQYGVRNFRSGSAS